MENMNIQNALPQTLSSYFNKIAMHFYEDATLMNKQGKEFGFDINKNYFLAMSFLYPSNTTVLYEEKCNLAEALTPLLDYTRINKAINSPQFLICDKGVIIFLIADTQEEIKHVSENISSAALDLLEQVLPNVFIRIGIGTIENGLSGIEHSYQNCLNAVNTGEKFKKERHILDFIGMEIYSAINAMVLAHGQSLISSILLQMTAEEQTILGKYYKCKEQISDVANALHISEKDIMNALASIKKKTGLDVNDTEDNFKLNFVMIAKRVLEKEKERL